jgi:hypothetical protein
MLASAEKSTEEIEKEPDVEPAPESMPSTTTDRSVVELKNEMERLYADVRH